MAAPIQRMFPSWASHFVCVSNQTIDSVNPRKELLQLQCPKNSSKTLLLGATCSGKTALLFQYALSCAMDGYRVVFITQRKLESMPMPVDGAPRPDPMLMKQVHIMYFEDRGSFLQYLAGIHTSASSPEVIVVDNLDYYVTHPKTSDQTATIGSLCAYLVDAATFLTNKRHKVDSDGDSAHHECQILASVSTPSSGEFSQESFYAYFLPSVMRIRGVKELDSVFQLTLQQSETFQKEQTVTYEIKECVRLLDISDGGVAMDSQENPTQEFSYTASSDSR